MAKNYTGVERADRYTPGSRDDRDPDWLLETTSLETIIEWVRAVHSARHERHVLTGHPIYTFWEWSYIESLERTLWQRVGRVGTVTIGSRHPFSGKQLVQLKELWTRLAVDAYHGMRA